MNKIFKVVWSKTKECYVVVSEVAKNNGGKKKVLASVLAGLAMVGAGAAGTPVQAADDYSNSAVNIAPNNLAGKDYKNKVDQNSVVVGYQNTTKQDDGSAATGDGHYIFGGKNQANNESTLAMGNNNKATGPSSTAIGSASEATGRNTIAMGNVAKANQIGNLAIGSYAKAQTSGTFISTVTHAPEEKGYAVALGGYAEATEHSTVAVGAVSKASGFKATAVGAGAQAKGDNSTVVGTASVANSGDSFVGGFKNVTHGDRNVAVGTNNTVAGEDSIGVGSGVIATTGKTIAIGNTMVNSDYPNGRQTIARGKNKLDGSGNPMYGTADVNNVFALAIGNGAQADGSVKGKSGMIAIGQEVTADDNNTIAMGVKTKATNGNATAVGSYAQALGSSSAAFGTQAVANGLGATAFGPGATAGTDGIVANGSTAVGRASKVTADGGTGIGWNTVANVADATAIGHNATANIAGGVALGSGSVTTVAAGSIGYNPTNPEFGDTRKRTYSGLNGTTFMSTLAAVSIGNGTNGTRQITGLAAGTSNTDAVNVAQLKSVNVRVGADTNTATVGTNKVAADFLAYNGQLNINGDGNRLTTVSKNDSNGTDANVNVKFDYDGLVKAKTGSAVTVDQKTDAAGKTYFEIDAAAGSKTVVADGKNTTVTGAGTTASPYKVNVEGALTGISSITNNGGGKIEFTTGGTTISGGPVNVSNNKITGVANGDVNSTSTDAVNGSQLHAVKTAERHIAPTTAGHEYTVDSNGDVTMTYLDGNNNAVANEKAVIKGIAKNDLSNITNEGKKEITKLGTIVKAGDNVNVTSTSDGTTGRTTYTVNAVTPAVYTKADGTKVVKRPDGTFTTNLDGSAGNNVDKGDVITSFMDGNGNTTGGNMVINNVGSAIDKTGTSTGNTFLTKLDAATTNTPNAAVNVKDLKTTSDALVDKGLKFTGNNTGTENTHKLGSLVKVQGEGVAATAVPSFASAAGNIAVVANGTDTLEIKLNKNLKGINSVSNGSSSITLNSNPGGTGNTPAVSITGGNVDIGGNNITNLKSGGDTDSNAANIGDVKKIASDTDTHIKPGTYTVAADKTVTMTYVNGKGETVKANGQDVVAKIDLSGLSTGGTSSTEKVQKAADATGDKNIADVNPKAGDTFGAADATYEVSVSRNAVKDAAREAVTINNGGIKSGTTYTPNADNPITVTPKEDAANHNTTYEVTFDGNKAAKQIPLTYKSTNGTVISANRTVTLEKGLNFTGGAHTFASVGADGKVIFDVKVGDTPTVTNGKAGIPGQAGAPGTDGIATISKVVETINNSGWLANAKSNGGTLDGNSTATVVKPGNTVNYAAGKNLIVKQELETDASNALTGNQTYTYSLDKDINVETVTVTGQNGKDGKIGINGKDGVTRTISVEVPGQPGQPGTPGADGTTTTRIVFDGKAQANLDDGMKYAGDDAQGTDKTKVIAKKLNETLDIIGGANKADLTTDNIGVNNDGNGKLLVQLSKKLNGINTIKNGNTTITLNDTPGGATNTPAVTITGGNLSLGDGTTNNKIVNLAPGTDDTDAVNYKQLKDAKTVLANGKNTTKSGSGTAADPYKVNVEGDLTEITSITNKADGSGNAGKITFSPNQTVTVSGDHNISLNGKTGDITGLTNTTIPTAAGSDFATKGRAATEEQLKIVNDKFNNKINLGADGNTETNKIALDNATGIKFNIKGDGSGTSGANQYISTTASGSDIKVDLTQDAKDKLNKTYDVKSTDKSVTVSSTTTNGVTTFDLKVTPVAGTTSTWDIKSSADTANGGATATGHETNAKTIANTNSVEMIAGKNLTVKQTSDTNGAKVEFALSDEITVGKDGANGVDGKIGVNGKDGASVVINGKDGSIGLTGPRGATGAPGASATLNVKDGVPGVDGAPGTNLTRIVYTDKNNVEHEVATHDDGMKFAGDDGQTNQATNANVIKKHLNNVVDIIGGATKADLTTNNIGVNNDGNGKLLVQLSKNLNGINTVKNGNTTITLNNAPGGATNTPAVTISGGNLSVDGNKVTNVDDGTDNNDAVNVKQLKAAKTEVKAGKNVVVTSDTTAADGHTTYTVSASTPVVYTTPDGTTKLIKQPDGTFKDENGNAYTGPVIASFEDGTGARTGGNMIVNNVGSAIQSQTGGDFLEKLDKATDATNTDARPNAVVNVSDLKNTKDGLIDKGLKFDANVGGVKTNKLGSTVKVQGAGTSADADYSGTNIKTFISQTGDDTTIDVKLDKNLKGINKISNGGSSITLNDTPSATVPAVTITGGNLSMGDGTTNNKIVNLAPGTADTDAVNVKQLKDTELHITPGTYTPGADKKVKLTYTDGNNQLVTGKEAVIDLSGLSTGGATASSWNVKSSANTTDGGAVGATHNANAQNIADGKSVEFQSGKNLVVNQTNDITNGNATVEFSLSDKITVGKDGANGKDGSVGAKGADGSAVVMNGADGSIGLNGTNGANGISIKGKDGANGVGIDGKDGVTRIVYTEKVPDPAHPGTTKEVTHEVATMDDGLKFTGNNTATENKHKLGSLVKVQGEGVTAADEAAFQSASGNIAVTADGTDTLTIRLNKNLKGLNSIQLGGNTIQSNGDNITFTTNGGTTKTVATTDQLWTIQANGTDVPATNGKVNVVGKDGITVAKNAAGNLEISGAGLGTMNGFDVTANNGATSKTIDNGKKVDFNAGSNLTVKQTNDATGTHIEYALKEAVDLGTNGSLKAGDTTVNKDGVTIANGPSITKTGVDAGNKKITNVADGDVNATSKDAVNGSQLKKYTDAAKTTVEAGDDNVKVETDNSAADGHTNYKVSLKPVVEIGDTHKVKIDGHTGDITGLTNVDLTDPTFATKGRAATEEQLNKVLTEAKKKAVEKVQAGTAAAGDTNIATVAPKAGDTFGAAGATYEVSVSKNAVKDAAKEAVKVTSASPAITVTADTSVAHETTYKVGFDGNQAATQIPLTYKQNGGNTRTVKLSDGLNFIDGTNTKARTAADGKVTFDVMGDLTGITSISNAAGGPKMTFGGSSINVTNGDLNMGGNKITKLATGTAKDDAATVGQLTKVTSNNHSVVINKTTDANGAPVYDLAVSGTPGAPAADPRVDMLGEEIGRVGAQGAALSALKPIQYDPLEPTQIMAGYGNYRGNSAVALGVAHYKNESTLIHGGVSWAGGSSHMMANAGVTWKVGNRDSEAAVADRYRKGPISSAYAMQQEMAAMKAQNAGLKGEVSDLKAENEQMKAQIAAMMAKLGL
ncbi:ESPR-type extended signal peptide-containing protein [Veillonella atypica]|uniref:ESPR-type extended signal peptide-containing protein n=1 Tax=Veillonella atypica TaxID=39777 RepID=UPI00352CD0BD